MLLRAFVAGALVSATAQAAGDGTILTSTYLAGTRNDHARGALVGPDGALWLVGASDSPDIPSAFLPVWAGGRGDAYVIRLDASTRAVLSAAWIGGSSDDQIADIAFDAAGNAYVAGTTRSPDFPATASVITPKPHEQNAFVARVAPDGRSFAWSLLFGGTGTDESAGVCVTADGDPVVVGFTDSPDFLGDGPAADAAAPKKIDGFVVRAAADGSGLAFARLLGGANHDFADAVARAADGRIVVVGRTRSSDFPSDRTYVPPGEGVFNGFAAEFDAADGARLRSRVWSGTWFSDVDAEAGGTLVCAGRTTDGNLGVGRFRHGARIDPPDAFALRLASDWTITGGTLFGGSGDEWDVRYASAPNGRGWLVGATTSPDLPLPGLPPGVVSGTADAFAAELATSDFRVVSGFMTGGSDHEVKEAVAAAPDGSAWLFGSTWSLDFPEVSPVESYAYGASGFDLFLVHAAARTSSSRPAAPYGVAARALSGHTVEVRWTASGAGVTSFEVDRAYSGNFERIAVLPSTARTYNDFLAQPDSGATYTVRAIGPDGPSVLSDDVRVVTPATLTPVVDAGTLRFRRRGPELDVTGSLLGAPAGDVPDVRTGGVVLRMYLQSGVATPLSIPPAAKGWRASEGRLEWRSRDVRFWWNTADGTFRVRVRRFGGLVTASGITVQMESGGEFGSAANLWRAETPRLMRTP